MMQNVELLVMHNDVVQLKKATSKLESKEMELQGMLFIIKNLKKELDELQSARTDLIEENNQLKSEKSNLKLLLKFKIT